MKVYESLSEFVRIIKKKVYKNCKVYANYLKKNL